MRPPWMTTLPNWSVVTLAASTVLTKVMTPALLTLSAAIGAAITPV